MNTIEPNGHHTLPPGPAPTPPQTNQPVLSQTLAMPPQNHETIGMGLLKRALSIIVTWNVLVACAVTTVILLGVIGAAFALGQSDTTKDYSYIYGKGTNEFLSVKISGVIVGSNDSKDSFSGLLGDHSQTYGYDVKDQLYAAADDDLIQGVILEIDSPGGTIYGAHAIADGVKYYRDKTHKPVYAHIEGTGASGAYWAAASADKIFADYGSATGSIGVIMGPFEYYDKVLGTDGGLLGGGVVTQNGIQSIYLTAGTGKDIGNPYRKLTDAEIAALQKTVNNEYDGFVSFVSSRRNIPEPTIRGQIGAMIYDPKSAQELTLIDTIGSRQDAYDALANVAKHKDDYTIIRKQSSPGFVGSLIGAMAGKPEAKASSVNLCQLTQSSLAYHGDISSWCSKDK